MQISSVPSQVLAPLQPAAQAAAQSTPDSAQQSKGNSARVLTPSREAANQEASPANAAQSEKITLSAELNAANDSTNDLADDTFDATASIFAEIWKDGVKIAVVDDRGSVTSLNGMPVTHFQSSGGTSLAAQRAARIAMELGGEIRVGGMSLDGPTLVMRDRLQTAYGAFA